MQAHIRNLARIAKLAAIFTCCSGFIVYGNDCHGGFRYGGYQPTNGPSIPYRINRGTLAQLDRNDPIVAVAGAPSAEERINRRMEAIKNAADAWNHNPTSGFNWRYNGLTDDQGSSTWRRIVNCSFFEIYESEVIATSYEGSFNGGAKPAKGTLASSYQYFCSGDVLRGFWMEIYTDPYVRITYDPTVAPANDLQTILTHEFGHSLGLDHNVVPAVNGVSVGKNPATGVFYPGASPSGSGVPDSFVIAGGHGDPWCTGDGKATQDLMCRYNVSAPNTQRVPSSDDLAGQTQIYFKQTPRYDHKLWIGFVKKAS